MSPFQRQKTISILDYFNGFGPLSMQATAAIAEIQLYYKNVPFLKYRKCLRKSRLFTILIYRLRAYEQLTPIYDNVSGIAKKKLSHTAWSHNS